MTCHIIYSVPRTTRSYPLPYTTTEHINTSTMKSISSAKKTRPARRNQRNDRGVSFDEMRRLMRVYGPIKCLRKRQSAKGGEDNTKADSVKRKFYRWFPDLDDRSFYLVSVLARNQRCMRHFISRHECNSFFKRVSNIGGPDQNIAF